LNPFFLREDVTQDGITVFALQGNTESSYEEHAAVYYNGYYWISVQCSDGSCVVLIYNTMLKTWCRAHGTGWDVIRFEWERSGSGTTFADVLEGGTESGWLIRYEPNPTIVGDHYDAETRCVAQTVLEGELKPPDREIDCKGILVDVDAGGQAVMCEVSLNDGPLQLVGTQFVGGAFLDGRSLAYFPINQERTTIAHKLSVRITVNQRTSRVTVFGIGCRYWVEPRADVSYSGQYFFTRAFGWCRRAQITMRSTSAVDLILIADGSEVYRTTLQQTNNERKGITVPFITGVEGKVIEYRMSSDDPFVLYEGSYIEAMELDSDRQMIPWQMVS
jgi:hypothetical protein